MNKPDWKDAPEWANYLAMDSDSAWYWFENKPSMGLIVTWQLPEGRIELALPSSYNWEETLETRPE